MVDSSDTAPKLETVRVLIVEDDPEYAEWIELTLMALGINNFEKAVDGVVALDLIDKGSIFDLIICDWLMPNMDGLTFLKRYREKVESSMFLLLTAKSGLEDVFEATQAGATNYLVKPLTTEELQEQVISMLH
jgi:two-component system chemotaxis response regulator CheY